MSDAICCGAAHLRSSRAVALALLRAAHLGFAAMSHADMAGTASLVPAMSRRSPNAHKKRHPGTDASIRPECLFCERMAHCYAHYLFENCGARLAALRPYFFLSFILESRVRYPAALSTGLNSASASHSALAIP